MEKRKQIDIHKWNKLHALKHISSRFTCNISHVEPNKLNKNQKMQRIMILFLHFHDGERWSYSFATSIAHSKSWSSSKSVTTSYIEGLCLGSSDRHLNASLATLSAFFTSHCPSILPSIILNTRLWLTQGLAQSTKFCSFGGFVESNAPLPHKISSRTAPKLYTSLFGIKWPNIPKPNSKFRKLY